MYSIFVVLVFLLYLFIFYFHVNDDDDDDDDDMMMDIYIAPAIRAIVLIVACSVRTGLPRRREREANTNKQTNIQYKQTNKTN